MQTSRRSLLGMMAATTMLAGCTTINKGSITTIIIDVAKVKTYATAGLNAAATIAAAMALVPAASAYGDALAVVTAALTATLTAFTSAAGSALTLTYNDSSIKTIIDSILGDLESLIKIIAQVAEAVAKSIFVSSTNITNTIQLVYSAMETVVLAFKTLLGVTSTTAFHVDTVSQYPQLAMSESQAIYYLFHEAAQERVSFEVALYLRQHSPSKETHV